MSLIVHGASASYRHAFKVLLQGQLRVGARGVCPPLLFGRWGQSPPPTIFLNNDVNL